MGNFFNTTNETGETLQLYESKAETQNKAITRLFFHEPILSPSQAWMLLNSPDTPLTSIRRSITQLTKSGYLVKLHLKIIGIYGRTEHQWCNKAFYETPGSYKLNTNGGENGN